MAAFEYHLAREFEFPLYHCQLLGHHLPRLLDPSDEHRLGHRQQRKLLGHRSLCQVWPVERPLAHFLQLKKVLLYQDSKDEILTITVPKAEASC